MLRSPRISTVQFLAFLVLTASSLRAEDEKDDGKLRIIAFGAHPDDAEFQCGGTVAMWAKAGHHVKLVSVTNGDIGHWNMAGGPLALRRTAEVKECAKRWGTTVQVLDIHDGEQLTHCRAQGRAMPRKACEFNVSYWRKYLVSSSICVAMSKKPEVVHRCGRHSKTREEINFHRKVLV